MLSLTEEIPYFGEHTQVTLSCAECGWRQTDFIPAQEREPCAWSLEVNEPSMLAVRVVRGSSGTVRIPELGLEASPGNHSTGYVSNIEGVLQRFIDIIEMLLRQAERDISTNDPDRDSAERDQPQLRELLDTLCAVRAGESTQPLTVELLDPHGHSAILDDAAHSRPLTEDERVDLEVGPTALILDLGD
jgi:zinc finger protein